MRQTKLYLVLLSFWLPVCNPCRPTSPGHFFVMVFLCIFLSISINVFLCTRLFADKKNDLLGFGDYKDLFLISAITNLLQIKLQILQKERGGKKILKSLAKYKSIQPYRLGILNLACEHSSISSGCFVSDSGRICRRN